MNKRMVLVGSYRDWPYKTASEKAAAYREEVRDIYPEVEAELEALGKVPRRALPLKFKPIKEQEMVRDLQNIFFKGRYRSWKPHT